MNVILLATDASWRRWYAAHPHGNNVELPHRGSLATFSDVGTWRIVRLDDWTYDERTISALRTIAARPGVTLVDPTGLLGGSRYGYDGNAPTRPSVMATVAQRRKPARSNAKRTNNDRDRTWG